MKIKRLFEKKYWDIVWHADTTSYGSICCYGNYFQMIHAIFRILIKK